MVSVRDSVKYVPFICAVSFDPSESRLHNSAGPSEWRTFGVADPNPNKVVLPDSGPDCWQATELELCSLGFHRLTTAQFHALCGQERCRVER